MHNYLYTLHSVLFNAPFSFPTREHEALVGKKKVTLINTLNFTKNKIK